MKLIKLTVTNCTIAILTLIIIVGALWWVDNTTPSISVSNQDSTRIRVQVLDVVDNSVIHNATVSVQSVESFYTDNSGLSPTITVPTMDNIYDHSIADWYCVTIVVSKEGYVPTVVVNSVLHVSQLRQLTVRMYPQDADSMPYVCYVESPPSQYLEQLVQ